MENSAVESLVSGKTSRKRSHVLGKFKIKSVIADAAHDSRW